METRSSPKDNRGACEADGRSTSNPGLDFIRCFQPPDSPSCCHSDEDRWTVNEDHASYKLVFCPEDTLWRQTALHEVLTSLAALGYKPEPGQPLDPARLPPERTLSLHHAGLRTNVQLTWDTESISGSLTHSAP